MEKVTVAETNNFYTKVEKEGNIYYVSPINTSSPETLRLAALENPIGIGLEENRHKLKNQKYGFVDKDDNIVIPFIYNNYTASFVEGKKIGELYCWGMSSNEASVRLAETNKWGRINEKGETTLTFEYDYLSIPFEGVIRASKGERDYILEKGCVDLCTPEERANSPFNKQKLFGFIDKTGKVLVPFEYTDGETSHMLESEPYKNRNLNLVV